MRVPFLPSALLFVALLAMAFVPRAHAGNGSDAKGGPQAKPRAGNLALEKTVLDYGVVEQNHEYSAEVGYTNRGTTPISKLRVKSGCGCYSVALSDTTLAPGARGTLTARFRTYGFVGHPTKKVHLLYDDGRPRQVDLELKLAVIAGILADRLYLGEVLAGTAPEGSALVRWHVTAGKPFEITSVQIAGEPIETRIEPYEPTPGSAYRGWRIHFRFTRPPPKGVYSKKAVVTTTLATQKQILIPITARVVGKVWVQTSRVYLGLIPQGRAKSASIVFRAFKPQIKLGRVSAQARGGILQVAIEDTNGPGGPAKRLRVSVPADAPVGSLDDVIELHTQVPGEELVTIQVRGRIFAPLKHEGR